MAQNLCFNGRPEAEDTVYQKMAPKVPFEALLLDLQIAVAGEIACCASLLFGFQP